MEHEVVTGLRPKLPAALDPAMPVEHLDLDGYMERLRVYFTQTCKAVYETQRNAAEEASDDPKGRRSMELEVGDRPG